MTDHVTAVANLVAAGRERHRRGPGLRRRAGVPAGRRGATRARTRPSPASRCTRRPAIAARTTPRACSRSGTGGGPDGQPVRGPFAGVRVQPDQRRGDRSWRRHDVRRRHAAAAATWFTLQWSEPRAIFPTAGPGRVHQPRPLHDGRGAHPVPRTRASGVQANGVGDTIEQIVTIDTTNRQAVKVVVNVRATSSAVAAPRLDLRWRGRAGADRHADASEQQRSRTRTTPGALRRSARSTRRGELEGFSSAGPVDLVLTTMCPGGGRGPCVGVAGPAAQTVPGARLPGCGRHVGQRGRLASAPAPVPRRNPGGRASASSSARRPPRPHTAGCDALVRDIIGVASTPAAVRARLASTATDLGPPGRRFDERRRPARLLCRARSAAGRCASRVPSTPTRAFARPPVCRSTTVRSTRSVAAR